MGKKLETFTFKVTVVDTYCKNIDVKAKNIVAAEEVLREKLEQSPIETQSNTLIETKTSYQTIPKVHAVESLFDIDSEEDILVVRVEDLNYKQRAFLGIK